MSKFGAHAHVTALTLEDGDKGHLVTATLGKQKGYSFHLSQEEADNRAIAFVHNPNLYYWDDTPAS